MKFLRNLLASILGTFVALGIIFVMFFILISLLGNKEDTVTVKSNSILELNIQGPISDYVGSDELNPFADIFDKPQGLDNIIESIQIAKSDDRIKGISIKNTFIMAGLAQTKAIRDALLDFKTSGKFIYTYGDLYMQKDYYLASVADSVFINPVGILDFKGLSTEVLYLKELQEKSGVKMEVIRHGKYKSAVEPYLEKEMSAANRKQLTELLASLWSAMLTDIANTRGISEQNLHIIADTLGGRSPLYAKQSGLIDEVLFYDEYETLLANRLQIDNNKDINYIELEDYTTYAAKQKTTLSQNKIAVIYAQGEIMYGDGNQDIIGQGIINKALIKAKEDDNVKAVVLRINSPGGSALASDIIWREVALTQDKKPLIVSMGNVAASGGYYIAAGATKIFAEPTTITGSIGVFGTVPNMSDLANDIGINAEQVGTNKNSIEYSLFDPMKEAFRTQIQESIENTYQIFLSRVSEGRGMTLAAVDSVAQGRVWSGTEALKVGLVDELGNLDDAIASAAEFAEIETYQIKKYPKYKSGFERLIEDLEGASITWKDKLLKDEIGTDAFHLFKEVKALNEQKGIQTKMPFILNIK